MEEYVMAGKFVISKGKTTSTIAISKPEMGKSF